MKVQWSYRCDFGHAWVVAEVVRGVEPDPGGCPEGGHVPVTARREPWADRVVFLLVPAARITDEVRGTVIGDDRFYLTLMDREGSELAISSRELTLSEAEARISELSRANRAKAVRKASRMGFITSSSPSAS